MTKPRKKSDLEQQDQVYPAALQYLARREYAPSELRRRLLQRGADPQVVEEVIERLLAGNWLNEERFAASRVRTRRDLSGRGRAAVWQELRSLGVDEEVSRAALEDEYDREQEAARAAELARRALADLERTADREARLKKVRSVQRRLLYRGFAPEAVHAATEKYLSAAGCEAEEDGAEG